MPTDEEREWIVAETARLVERAGLERYVAHVLVEPSDRWFPDEWHPDHNGVKQLAERVFEHAGLAGVTITTLLAEEGSDVALDPLAIEKDRVELEVDPAHLRDPLTLIAALARLAAIVLRLRHELADDDEAHERELVDLTTIYLGFGIITTNAAYRYRADGRMEGYTAITNYSHDEQGALAADLMAWALALQIMARGGDEKSDVARQLETNQAEVFGEACRQLKSDYAVLLLGLPAREKWPARHDPPGKPARRRKQKEQLPKAVMKSSAYAGINSGRQVIRMPDNRAGIGAFAGGIGSLVPTVALAVEGYGVVAMFALVGTFGAGLFLGSRSRYHVCSGCGLKLAPAGDRCPRCNGKIAGTANRKENYLEAEERLGINQDEYDMDVGEAEASGIARARVHPRSGNDRDTGVDG